MKIRLYVRKPFHQSNENSNKPDEKNKKIFNTYLKKRISKRITQFMNNYLYKRNN